MRRLAVAALCLLALFVTPAAALDPEEAEALFISSLKAAQAGRHDLAITGYRLLLKEVPTPRIKLELARSLLHSSRSRQALALFREVYEHPRTPQIVKRNILPFMEEAELRILRIRFGLRGISDSNPSRVAEGGTIFFNGDPYEYRPPVSKEFSHGVEPWISVEKLWLKGLLTRFYGSVRFFDNEDLNSGSLAISIGRQIERVKGLFVQTNLASRIRSDGDSYVLPTVEAWKSFSLSARARIGVGGQIGYLTSENEHASGAFYKPYLFGDWTFLANATLFGRLSAEHLNSRNDYYSYTSPSIELGLKTRLAGFDLTPQLSLTRTDFAQYDAFWGLRRKDTTVRPSLAVSHERMTWKGIRPKLTLFYEERNSNVEIYNYDQAGAFLNVTRIY